MAIKFVVCVNKPQGGEFSMDDVAIGQIYEVVEAVDQRGFIRILDQSGEDYLYPAPCFEPVSLSETASHRLHDALKQAV